jgi:hypothetical protein
MRNAISATGCPVGEYGEDYFFAKVGLNFPYYDKSGPIVESITVTNDLDGPNCDMDRVRVFGAENTLLWEGPLHNLEGVSYV